MPARFDFTAKLGRAFYRGDHRTIDFQCLEDGIAKDITGATWLGQVRAQPGGEVLLTLTIATVDAAQGTWRWSWDDSDGEELLGSDAVDVQAYRYDIQRTLGGVVTTLVKGRLEIDPDITRAP